MGLRLILEAENKSGDQASLERSVKWAMEPGIGGLLSTPCPAQILPLFVIIRRGIIRAIKVACFVQRSEDNATAQLT